MSRKNGKCHGMRDEGYHHDPPLTLFLRSSLGNFVMTPLPRLAVVPVDRVKKGQRNYSDQSKQGDPLFVEGDEICRSFFR
jgi:hypothetical protein